MNFILFVSYEISIDSVLQGKGWCTVDINPDEKSFRVAADFSKVLHEVIANVKDSFIHKRLEVNSVVSRKSVDVDIISVSTLYNNL